MAFFFFFFLSSPQFTNETLAQPWHDWTAERNVDRSVLKCICIFFILWFSHQPSCSWTQTESHGEDGKVERGMKRNQTGLTLRNKSLLRAVKAVKLYQMTKGYFIYLVLYMAMSWNKLCLRCFMTLTTELKQYRTSFSHFSFYVTPKSKSLLRPRSWAVQLKKFSSLLDCFILDIFS